LAAELKRKYGVQPELVAGSGGIFEVYVNGTLVFSKIEVGRFPEHREIFDKVDALVR
jgi:selT/selW/selH-like putative selenoprotein